MTASRLHLVVGKGGVGKSTVTAAMALALMQQGRRVLALELDGPGGLARAFGVTPDRPASFLRVRHRLSVGFVDGQSALAEYLGLVIPIRRLLDTVFGSRIYKNFVAAAPGLKELMTMGKVWYEFQRCGDDGRPVWDAIVVDAGASGHSLQYLQMPAAAARTFRSGLVHRESQRVAALLGDAATTRVHVVTVAEDMPLAEALQILARLRGELRLPVGRLFVNRWRAEAPEGARAVLERLSTAAPAGADGASLTILEGVRSAGYRCVQWAELQRRSLDRFQARMGLQPILLPLLAVEEFGTDEVERLASLVAHGPREVVL